MSSSPNDAARTSNDGAGRARRPGRVRNTILLCAVLIVIVAAGLIAKKALHEEKVRWNFHRDPGVEMQPVPLPEAQEEFAALIERHADAFPDNGADGDPLPTARLSEIGELLKGSQEIDSWRGLLLHKGTTLSGRAFVTIDLLGTERIRLRTWSSDRSDLRTDTLIDAGSTLHAGLEHLSEGDQVEFSGTFVGTDGEFVAELSATERGEMKMPQFLFRFTKVTGLEGKEPNPSR